MTTLRRLKTTHLLLAPALLTAASLSALGQQPVNQSGRVLDRNPQVGSGGINPRNTNVRDQIWFNNQIITGNAPAGRSFRGYVGYTAPGDFRGFSPSDDQYNFRRDSTSGAAVATGVRASDALRYQMALTTGQAAPSYLANSYFTQRESKTATGAAVAASSGESALRSTADYLASRSLRPTFVGSRTEANGTEWNATASTLLGLSWMRVNRGPADAARARPAADPVAELIAPGTAPVTPGAPATPTSPDAPNPSVTPGAPAKPEPRFEGMTPTGLEARAGGFRSRWDTSLSGDLRVSSAIDNAVGSDAVPIRSAAHVRAIESLKSAYNASPDKPADDTAGSTPGAAPRTFAERDLDRLKRLLRGLPAEPAKKPEPGDQPDIAKLDPARPDGQPAKIDPDKQPEVSPEILRALKALGEKSLDSLSPDIESQTDPHIYKLHMQGGQRAIADERYFDAEDRFIRALAAMPNDPMAKAGRVHAELGAGLYLSASRNLRQLIADHPEMVGMRFNPKLGPTGERTKIIARQLRAEIDKGSTGLGLETSLLLAYLGRLTGNQSMTDEGLRAMAARQPDNDSAEAALLATLRGVWGK